MGIYERISTGNLFWGNKNKSQTCFHISGIMDLVKIFCFGYNFVYNLCEFFWVQRASHQFVYAVQQLVKPFNDFILMLFNDYTDLVDRVHLVFGQLHRSFSSCFVERIAFEENRLLDTRPSTYSSGVRAFGGFERGVLTSRPTAYNLSF